MQNRRCSRMRGKRLEPVGRHELRPGRLGGRQQGRQILVRPARGDPGRPGAIRKTGVKPALGLLGGQGVESVDTVIQSPAAPARSD
jgi:hypothetical protein